MNKLEAKTLTFIALMGALGNIISFITTQLAPIAPNIPLGPVSVSLALDLSHLATFIAAFFGGSTVGGLAGAVGGLVAAFEFGFSKGNLVTGFGLPLGKAMTGYTAGYLFNKYEIDSSLKAAFFTLVSYVPEAVLTLILFRYLLPSIMGLPENIATLIGFQIIVKASIEMVILGIVLMYLLQNPGFKRYTESYFK
jgi:hypothetical protein